MNQRCRVNSLVICTALVLVIALGYFVFIKNHQQSLSEEPITYTKNDQLFSVSKKEFVISSKFTAIELNRQAQECGGYNKAEQYFTNLLSKYGDDEKGTEYSFKYRGQTENFWTVTVIPNKPEFANLNDFRKNFDICAGGGDLYPSMISNRYLLFVSSCGTGVGSGPEIQCDAVRTFVEPSLKLK